MDKIFNEHYLGMYTTDAPVFNLFVIDDFGNLVMFNYMTVHHFYLK